MPMQCWLFDIAAVLDLQVRGILSLPLPVQAMRDYILSDRNAPPYMGWALAIIFTLVLLAVGINRRQRRREMAVAPADNPRKLFNDLLAGLELADGDRKLLRHLARTSRLRHPAMCLLTPGLLEWSRQVWRAEAGPEKVDDGVTRQLHDIAFKVHGFRPKAGV